MIFKIKACCLLCDYAELSDDCACCGNSDSIKEYNDMNYTDVCDCFRLRDMGYDVETIE